MHIEHADFPSDRPAQASYILIHAAHEVLLGDCDTKTFATLEEAQHAMLDAVTATLAREFPGDDDHTDAYDYDGMSADLHDREDVWRIFAIPAIS